MDLVDRDRPPELLLLLARAQPRDVVRAPAVMRLEHHRRRLRRHLGLERVRVGLQQQLAVRAEDLVLVARAGSDAGEEQLPDPGRPERAHRVQPAVPRVEVADDADRPGRRRPHRERGAGDRRACGWAGLHFPEVRAELVVQLLVPALADQVLVELADRRHERVRIVDRELAGVAVVDLEPVAQRQLGVLDHALEHAAGVDLLELDGGVAVGHRGHRARRRAQDADDDAAVLRMGAEDGMRIGVLAADERLELAGGDGHAPSKIRPMPATGIEIQSGRLLSS